LERDEGREHLLHTDFFGHGSEFLLAKMSRDGKATGFIEKKIYGRKVQRNNQVIFHSVFATFKILSFSLIA